MLVPDSVRQSSIPKQSLVRPLYLTKRLKDCALFSGELLPSCE